MSKMEDYDDLSPSVADLLDHSLVLQKCFSVVGIWEWLWDWIAPRSEICAMSLFWQFSNSFAL